MTVQIADLPQVKATLDAARRRLREQEGTIQRLIAQADENGRQIAELQEQLAAATRPMFMASPSRTIGSGW